MNEIKPTAKAAKTVVSTPLDMSELVALQVRVEPRRVGSARRCSRRWRALPAPPQGGDPDAGQRGEKRQRWHDVGGQVEPLSRRERQHAIAELRHEGGLDLRLGPALRDQRVDQG